MTFEGCIIDLISAKAKLRTISSIAFPTKMESSIREMETIRGGRNSEPQKIEHVEMENSINLQSPSEKK